MATDQASALPVPASATPRRESLAADRSGRPQRLRSSHVPTTWLRDSSCPEGAVSEPGVIAADAAPSASEATAPLRMAALRIALSLIVLPTLTSPVRTPRGHAEWSAASNLR